MIDQKLLKYIKEQLSKGYSIEQVKEYLIKYGYAINVVEDTIGYMHDLQKDVSNAYSGEIKFKVSKALDHGYSKEQIIQELLGQGFSYDVIKVALNECSIKEVHHHIHWTPIAVTVVLCVAIFFSVMVFFGGPEEVALLDVKLGMLSQDVVAGGNLIFNVDLSNLGTKQRYDVTLKYEVVSLDDGRLLISESETKAVATTLGFVQQLDVPHFASDGNYRLDVLVSYSDQVGRANASVVFSIGSVGPSLKIECTKNMHCASGFECENHKCVEIPVVEEKIVEESETVEVEKFEPVSIKIKSVQEEVDEFVALVEEDISKAKDICSDSSGLVKDVCFFKVAEIAEDVTLCDSIIDDERRDKCYFKLDACSLVTDNFRKLLCEKKELFMNDQLSSVLKS